ncbi:MAG: hypothetical protein WBA67_03620 [Jannaschia sp.]
MTQQNFLSNESGAVTVDWVVLTAALVGLGLAVMAVVSGGIEDLSGDVNTQLTDGSIIRTGFTGNVAAIRDSACGAFGGCDPSLDAATLSSLTNSEFAGVSNVSYGDDYLSNNGLTFDGDGALGRNVDIDDGNGNITSTFQAADQSEVDAYTAANNAQTSQNALIAREAEVRAN